MLEFNLERPINDSGDPEVRNFNIEKMYVYNHHLIIELQPAYQDMTRGEGVAFKKRKDSAYIRISLNEIPKLIQALVEGHNDVYQALLAKKIISIGGEIDGLQELIQQRLKK